MKQHTVEFFESSNSMRAFVERCDRDLEAQMTDVARRIAKTPSLHLLGLTGPTCSGKTTAAGLMTDYLERHGHRVHVISIDDFYYDKEFLNKRAEEDPDIEIDYDSESTIDLALLSEKIESLVACRPTRLPHFDFETGLRVEGELITPSPDDVILFEGIQVLYPCVHAMLSRYEYRCIYICPASSISVGGEAFLPNEIRLMRRLVRDHLHRATDPAFTLYLWQSVRENEEKSIFPNADACHFRIDSVLPYEVGMLKPYLEKGLGEIAPDNAYYADAQAVLTRLSRVQSIPSTYIGENSLYHEFI